MGRTQCMWSILQLGGPSVVCEAGLLYAGGRESAIHSARVAPLCWLPRTVCWVSLDALPQLVAARLPVWGANAEVELERVLWLG